MFFSKLFDSNESQIKKLKPIVQKINSLEEKYEKLSKDNLRELVLEHKDALKNMTEENQKFYLDKILPDVYAIVREASKRTLNKRHFDVQLMAGIVLHQGKISEQKTGEGKTLTATLPLFLNSLTGKGVHLVTPNDYLSRHGAGWMGPVYDYLGASVGVIIEDKAYIYDSSFENPELNDEYAKRLKPVQRRDAYKSDITYGTNHHFGFDYLRDNMVYMPNEIVQTNPNGDYGFHNFAIVDEVDSILIDVARTPLIISAAHEQPVSRYKDATNVVKTLLKGTDYDVDEKFKSSTLTDLGIRKVEKMLGVSNLYEQDFEMVHLIEQALTAQTLYQKDKDYVVKDGKVVIVDQFTGRLLPNNRYSQGLHQAIESKENVEIQQESRTRAEISYQNYFRLYKKLAGMTGTALTEAEEFYKIYKLDVVVIPTHKPTQRIDYNDVVYKTEAGKFKAVADEIAERHKKGQPVLVGTTSVDKSQLLHDLLVRRGVPHEILNAKNHEKEAMLISQAGKKGAVTVSTNMAGRGVDIILGGDPSTPEEQEEIKQLGGLHVIGTERHESRRIDNQLRGRAGRQGDPGSSRFYISLQDDLMRIFGGDQIQNLMTRFGLDENVPLEARIVSKSIESAQKKVEGFNFDRRKQLVEMDDVMNTHREVVYKIRRKLLMGQQDGDAYKTWFLEKLSKVEFFDVSKHWDTFEQNLGLDTWAQISSQISLQVVDILWMEHLVDMSMLRDGIGLRGYAQRDPMIEYKREGHEKFESLVEKIYYTIAERLSKIENVSAAPAPVSKKAEFAYSRGHFESGVSDEKAEVSNVNRIKKVLPVVAPEKIGRNDPCPCGSGKKYKQCGLISSPEHLKNSKK